MPTVLVGEVVEVSKKGSIMAIISKFFHDLHDDKSGVSFIEYTALLGVILAVGLLILTKVGNWANLTWSTLCSGLGANCS